MDELVGRVPPADWMEARDRELEDEHFAMQEEFDDDLAVRDRLWEKGGLSQAENAAMLRFP